MEIYNILVITLISIIKHQHSVTSLYLYLAEASQISHCKKTIAPLLLSTKRPRMPIAPAPDPPCPAEINCRQHMSNYYNSHCVSYRLRVVIHDQRVDSVRREFVGQIVHGMHQDLRRIILVVDVPQVVQCRVLLGQTFRPYACVKRSHVK